jgi:hypothetical protein
VTIPLKTFVMRENPYGRGTVWRTLANGSKQTRIIHDKRRKRNIIFGGDYANALVANSAPGMTWAYDPIPDVVDGASNRGVTLVAKKCSGPGNVDPGTPNDGQACGMDYQNDCFWANEGGWFGSAHGDPCTVSGNAQIASVAGSTYHHGLMRMNPTTGIWTGVSRDVVAFGVKNGYFDPVQRCLIGLDGANVGIRRVYVDGAPSSVVTRIDPAKIGCVARPPGRYFAGGNQIAGQDWAIDVVGRWGYVLSSAVWWPAGAANFDHYENVFWRFSLDDPAIQQALPFGPFGSPTTYATTRACGPTTIHLSWDSRNRKVVWFYAPTICAMIRGIGVYDPVQDAWENLPLLQTPAVGLNRICANAIGYDSTNNVHILMGSVFCPEDSTETAAGAQATHYMLWRYA